MAFVATLSEMLSSKIDDNLTVPLFAGFVGQMIVYVVGIELPAIELPPIDFSFLGLF